MVAFKVYQWRSLVLGISGPRGPVGGSSEVDTQVKDGAPGSQYVVESKVENVVYYGDRKVMDQAPGKCVVGLVLVVSFLDIGLM